MLSDDFIMYKLICMASLIRLNLYLQINEYCGHTILVLVDFSIAITDAEKKGFLINHDLNH